MKADDLKLVSDVCVIAPELSRESAASGAAPGFGTRDAGTAILEFHLYGHGQWSWCSTFKYSTFKNRVGYSIFMAGDAQDPPGIL